VKDFYRSWRIHKKIIYCRLHYPFVLINYMNMDVLILSK